MNRALLGALLCALFNLTISARGDEPVHLSAYYYPWYDTDGRHWRDGYIGKFRGSGPALGEYSSRDPDTIVKHVNWSRQMGVRNWVCAWWGKDSWEDVTIKYRIAPILDQLADSKARRPMDFCLFYESEGLLGLDPDKGIEFDFIKTRKFVDDFIYIADTYFSHPSYYRINDRPVVYLYLSRTFTGNYSAAIEQMRNALRKKGINIYLVGDEVYWGEPDVLRIEKFDAITSYNMHGPPPEFDTPGDWTRFIDDCEAIYQKYQSVAKQQGVAFIPGLLPGFNSHSADPGNKHYIIPRSFQTRQNTEAQTINEFIRISKTTLDPTLRSATITSFNEWHEGTQMEPSTNGSEEFPSLLDFSRGVSE